MRSFDLCNRTFTVPEKYIIPNTSDQLCAACSLHLLAEFVNIFHFTYGLVPDPQLSRTPFAGIREGGIPVAGSSTNRATVVFYVGGWDPGKVGPGLTVLRFHRYVFGGWDSCGSVGDCGQVNTPSYSFHGCCVTISRPTACLLCFGWSSGGSWLL